jgi:hypothetical protein
MKKHHAEEHKIYPGKPFSNKGENPAKSFSIIFKRKTFITKNILAHKRVHKILETLAPKRGVQL